MTTGATPLKVMLIAGEESGDMLGARLMQGLKDLSDRPLVFSGVGGTRMTAEGLTSLFPMSDLSVMGLSAVLGRIRLIIKRVYQAVDAAVAENPDVLVLIDSPDFTHNVAKRVRKRAPHIKIVGYVSPTVWAWRPGRAKKMSAYVDRLMAILPFEPEIHRKLSGPPTDYVGHPLIEAANALRPAPGERSEPGTEAPVLLLLPGSRGSEVRRLMSDFGEIATLLKDRYPDLQILLPAVPHLKAMIAEMAATWPVKPEIVEGEAAKRAAFRKARAALAASGTVSLELAISGVPMVVCYKLDWFLKLMRVLNEIFKMSSVSSMVLPNIILSRNVVPEFLDDDASVAELADKVALLLEDSTERRTQIDAFSSLDDIMRLEGGQSQGAKAAQIVLDEASN